MGPRRVQVAPGDATHDQDSEAHPQHSCAAVAPPARRVAQTAARRYIRLLRRLARLDAMQNRKSHMPSDGIRNVRPALAAQISETRPDRPEAATLIGELEAH